MLKVKVVLQLVVAKVLLVSLVYDSVKVGSCLRFVSLFCDRFAQLLLYRIIFI